MRRQVVHAIVVNKTQTRSCTLKLDLCSPGVAYVYANTAHQQQLSTPSIHITIPGHGTAYIRRKTPHTSTLYYCRGKAGPPFFSIFSNDHIWLLFLLCLAFSRCRLRSKNEHEHAWHSHFKGGRVTGRRPRWCCSLICIRRWLPSEATTCQFSPSSLGQNINKAQSRKHYKWMEIAVYILYLCLT
jgi:hypothetical protein